MRLTIDNIDDLDRRADGLYAFLVDTKDERSEDFYDARDRLHRATCTGILDIEEERKRVQLESDVAYVQGLLDEFDWDATQGSGDGYTDFEKSDCLTEKSH